MTNWEEVHLSDVCTIKYGKDHKELLDGEIPVYGSGGIMRYANKCIHNKKSVLIPRKGTLSNLFLVDPPFWTVDTLFWTDIDNTKANTNYLYYFLKTMNLSDLNVGTAVPSLTTALLNEIVITLPPLPEQKAIADTLSCLDDKIELNNKINKNLEEMAQTIFKSWFVDFEPFKDGEFVDSELGEIPKGWRVGTLGNETTIIRGSSPRPIQDFLTDKGIPWIKISDATASTSKYLMSTNQFIKASGIKNSREVLPDTLILSNSATPGLPKIVKIKACVHDGWLIFSDYNSISKEILYYQLLTDKEKILSQSNGSVFRNLKTDILKKHKIVIPDTKTIEKATTIFQEINNSIFNFELENQKLAQIRDTLLPKLMSSKVRVPYKEVE